MVRHQDRPQAGRRRPSAPPSGSRSTAATAADECPFSDDGDADGPLPIITVDDEIYRNPPTFLLATVDKFARLAREGEAASLFGYVAEWCPRHGYRHPDSRGACTGASHNAKKEGGRTYPKVTVQPVDRLRPPDLIIQDELHLITGALGTAVGVFENAIDLLSSYAASGQTIRPLVVASTATVRNAEEPGASALRPGRRRVPAAGARRARHLLLAERSRSPTRTRAGSTSASAPTASG